MVSAAPCDRESAKYPLVFIGIIILAVLITFTIIAAGESNLQMWVFTIIAWIMALFAACGITFLWWRRCD